MNCKKSNLSRLITNFLLIIFLLGVGFCFGESANAQEEVKQPTNLRILYQGQLTDSGGNPLEDGRYNIRFVIYDEETQGNILWQEEYIFYNGISVENGQFKVILGREKPIILNLDEAPFWLGVTLGTLTEENQVQWGEEIQPRKKITILSELLGVEELTPEQWENLSQLIKEKLGEETDTVLLFDVAQLESLGTEQGTDFSSSIISFFQNFINFISEKISEIGEKINQILAKIDSIISTLTNIVSTLAEMKHKIDVLYEILVVKPGLEPTESEPPSSPLVGITSTPQDTGRLVIKGGEDSIKVIGQLVQEDSLIFVSFLENPGSAWWISEKIPGEYFILSLKEPASRDLRFDYWVFNKNNPLQPEPEGLTCIPNWSCTEWQPLPETVVCGESFTQIRTCTDLNNCGVEEGKPEEIRETSGTNCSAPNAVGDCQMGEWNGACAFACQEGYQNCNNDWSDGCETEGSCSENTNEGGS